MFLICHKSISSIWVSRLQICRMPVLMPKQVMRGLYTAYDNKLSHNYNKLGTSHSKNKLLVSNYYKERVYCKQSLCTICSCLVKSPSYNMFHHGTNTAASNLFSSQSRLLFIKSEDRKDVNNNTEEDPEKNLSLVQKFKLMYKQYWYVLIPVHVVTSIVWFGSFYFMAKSGVDIVPTLEYLGVADSVLDHLRDSNAGYYAIAYAMYKLATPARYTITLGGTTISINYLKNWGYIKPVPSKEKLKEMYTDKKEELIEKKDEVIERYQERREDMKEKYQEKKEEMIEKYQEKKEELIDKYQERKDNIKEKLANKKSVDDDSSNKNEKR